METNNTRKFDVIEASSDTTSSTQRFDLIERKDTFITLNYIFGSYPARGFENSEVKSKNGLLGGYFTFEIDDNFYAFCDIGRLGYWEKVDAEIQTDAMQTIRYMTIRIPITNSQKTALLWAFSDFNDRNKRRFTKKVEYEIPSLFFRTRHIATIYTALSRISLLPSLPKTLVKMRFPYERTLRRYLMQRAFKTGWKLEFIEGRETRVWESV